MKEKALIIILFIFSFWLMFHTFGYDSQKGDFLISSKVWSDFGSLIPLIRSFSQGSNWPPQHPLFPGEPIRYHYLFYLTVAFFEKLGLSISLSLNIISALGFFFLLMLIYIIGKRIFKSSLVGYLGVLFFLFNGSLSLLDFLRIHPLSSLPALVDFVSFRPWNSSLITAFWNLNIYSNQRHLAPSFVVVLLIILALTGKSKRLKNLVGFLFGSLLLLNQAAFAIAGLFIAVLVVFQPKKFLPVFVSLWGLLPWLYFYFKTTHPADLPVFEPGYLSPHPLNIIALVRFWFANLGLHFILIPLGFLVAPKNTRIFIPFLLLLFIIPNLIRFSPDMINNHKFFNFFILFGSFYSACLLKFILDKYKKPALIVVPVAILFLTSGGITDFFPVKNDYFLRLADAKTNPDVSFFNSVPAESVVLNSTWFYHPASLAGRSIYNGYSYFTWSYGYDQITRENFTKAIYLSPDLYSLCRQASLSRISYFEISPNYEKFITPNMALFDTLSPEYTGSKSGIRVYSLHNVCLNNEI